MLQACLRRSHELCFLITGWAPQPSGCLAAPQEFGVVGYTLLLSVIEYKTLVMRGDMDAAAEILPQIPQARAGRPAHAHTRAAARRPHSRFAPAAAAAAQCALTASGGLRAPRQEPAFSWGWQACC